MRRPRSKSQFLTLADTFDGAKQRKGAPYPFVLDALEGLSPKTRQMFGCLAIDVADKIVLILREKPGTTEDNGVWLATTKEHHESLRGEFPNMRSIGVLGKKVTGWQILGADTTDFEQAAMRACELVIAKDPHIGKIPASRRARSSGGENRISKSKKSRKQAAKG